ncbi:MAG: 50S ribosomal protein L35 [Gammaproteobacteria bacterium]|nr:50S ribosomal protein L35 [Gammaproteobacteria bacterium]
MSKLKTHRGAAKRFRRSGSGFKYRPANKNHILTKKAPKRKRQLRAFKTVSAGDKRSVSRMLPKKAR